MVMTPSFELDSLLKHSQGLTIQYYENGYHYIHAASKFICRLSPSLYPLA